MSPAAMDGDVHWAAILATSERVDGKPRQRHIAYLGSIYESWLSKVLGRAEFWDKISKRLDALANQISHDERHEIEAAIGRKVPRPSDDERRAADAKATQELNAMASAFAHICGRRH